MSLYIDTVDSMKGLRLYDTTDLPEGTLVRMSNYYAQTGEDCEFVPFGLPGGGGLYRWDPCSEETPNQGSIVASYGPEDYTDSFFVGRWILVHDGFVNVRQFGALGVESGSPKTLDDLITYQLFSNFSEALATYPGTPGSPFSGLKDSETFDWVAIQAALTWCGASGVRCEVPSGVFKVSRPVWMGDDTTYAIDGDGNNIEAGAKDSRVMGLTLVGQTGNSRQQADGGVANIRLINDCAHRFALTFVDPSPAVDTEVKLKMKVGTSTVLTGAYDGTETAGTLISDLHTALTDYTVALCDAGDSSTVLNTKTIYFTVTPNTPGPAPAKFRFEVLAVSAANTNVFVNWVHCFPDCAVVSFRRSAGLSYRLEHLTLAAEGPIHTRFASFGVLFVTSQFFGHIVENVEMAYVDTAVGILKGTGDNGEQSRIDRLHALEIRRMLYTNAPQAFSQEFLGWNGHLQNEYKLVGEVEVRDLTDLVYAEFDEAAAPGFGANFYNASGTFSDTNNPESDATVVRAKRGTGTVQFVGGRFEHTTRLFNYDATSGQGINNNMDVVFRGVEFTVVGGGERRIVEGEKFEDVTDDDINGTQYGLFVDTCTFDTYNDDEHPEYADLIFESIQFDKIRCVFQNSRFLGVRSLPQRTIGVAFRQCYKTDFIASGANESPLRQFTDEPSTPGVRTQSLRNSWQDTPWIQTGPRVNILRNADFADQDYSDGPLTDVTASFASPWTLTGGTGDDPLAGFGKWAAFMGETDPIDKVMADLSPSPEAFYMALYPENVLSQIFDESGHSVDLKVDGPKVCTYQCLCRIKGTMRFALVDSSDSSIVFDEMIVTSPDGYCDTTLVTLRAQVLVTATGGGSKHMKLVVQNPSGTAKCQWQVFWQQAWASERTGGTSGDYTADKGLRNTAFVRTDSNSAESNDFVWGLNSLSVKAVGRLQIPNLNPLRTEDSPVNVGWKNPYDTTGQYDLFDGEIYWDAVQQGVVCRMAEGWYMLHQPDRVNKTFATSTYQWTAGDPNILIYTGSAVQVIELDTDVDKIVPGTVVRVAYQFAGGISAGPVSVDYGAASNLSITINKSAEFVFYNDGGTGKWYMSFSNVDSPH